MEVFFEFTQIGNAMRVTAIDAETGIEVVIQGPATASKKTLQQTALTKLRYVMEKEHKKPPSS